MQIPVGLMSPTALRNQRTYGNPDQGYWEGDRYIFPKYKPKPPPSLMSPDLAKAVQTVQDTAQKAQEMAIASATVYGDGAQGEGFSGGRDGPVAPGSSPSFSESGHVNAPDQNANVQGMMGQPATANPAGLPSLPSFQEQAPAPAAPTAPTNQDLAVSEVDPQGPSGAASAGKGKSAASQESRGINVGHETGALSRSSIDKAVQEKGLIDALKDAMQATAPGIGIGLAAAEGISPGDTTTGAPGGFAPGHDKESKDYGGGSDNSGGPGSSGASGTSGTGPNAGDEGGLGAWRRGGRTGNDGDKRRLEPRGVAHEDEFYLNPEMTSLMDRRAPGLLDAMDRFQKGLMDRPRKQARGLMGR